MQLLPLLACRLRIVAGDAKALPVVHVVPRASVLADQRAVHHGRHVIGVGFPLVGTYPTARSALPRVTGQHGLTPRLVPLVGVASLVAIGPFGIRPLSGPEPRRRVCRDAGWHLSEVEQEPHKRGCQHNSTRSHLEQEAFDVHDLKLTTPTVPVELVAPLTILTNGRANTSSGRA